MRLRCSLTIEPDSRFETQWVSTRARASRRCAITLDGHKAVVMHAGAADTLLVSARTSGEPQDAQGMSLFRVPRDAKGLKLDRVSDHRWSARRGCLSSKASKCRPSSRLGVEGGALPLIEAALDIGLAALCAEAVGVMQALVDATVTYVQSRQQFGAADRPISGVAASHRRHADSSGTGALDELPGRAALHGRERRSSAAAPCRRPRPWSGQSARFVGQQAVQLHGGMGMTDELIVSHWFKRLTAAELMFGDSDTHLQRYAALTRE